MKRIPFEKLYNQEFFVSEPIAKAQYWVARGNVYNAIGAPKISHTLLWFKNCGGTITDARGRVLTVTQNQLVYMAKGLEYVVQFEGTHTDREDTVVIHFQLTDKNGEDIIPSPVPVLCSKNVDTYYARLIEEMADECRKNVVCVPELIAGIYKLLSMICQKQKRRTTKKQYACILAGIELLEEDSDHSIAEIAEICGISECYFRRLFQEYSGESPMQFRQHRRIEKSKQLLLADESFSITEIAQALDFSDVYHFSKTFKKFCGMSPTAFIRAERDKLAEDSRNRKIFD